MEIDSTTISMPMAALLASLIGATATITASLLNLRMAWKKELLARANNKPVTRKSKRGPVFPVVALLIASAVGGFALSYYLGSNSRAEAEAQEAELRMKIDQLLSLSTQRTDTANPQQMDTIVQQVREQEQQRRGVEGNVTMVILEKCVPETSGGLAESKTCTENMARPVRLCTEIPANATVTSIDLFARPEGDSRPWNESRVNAGSDFGAGRYAPRTTERLISDSTKQVCQEVLHWNSEHDLTGRMVVHYKSAD